MLNRNAWNWEVLFIICLMSPHVVAGTPARESRDLPSEYEFAPLFDGSSLEGWSHEGNWEVQEGLIVRTQTGGHLVCKKREVPNNFELRFEWKISPGGNSGVFYRPGRYEYQILDNSKHVNGKNPRTTAAALYFCMQPSVDATKPVGEWNLGRVLCKGSQIQHWLNGIKVIDFDHTDPRYRYNIGMMKARGGDITSRGGHVKLQDHGAQVWYRNLELRQVADSEILDSTPVKPAKISQELLEAERIKIKQTIAYIKRRTAEKAAEQQVQQP